MRRLVPATADAIAELADHRVPAENMPEFTPLALQGLQGFHAGNIVNRRPTLTGEAIVRACSQQQIATDSFQRSAIGAEGHWYF